MWYIQRTSDPSSLIGGIKFASFVGGGGKTTLIEHLARSCVARNRSVAVVTTTKIFAVEPFVVFDDWVKRTPRRASYMHIGKTAEGRKLTGLSCDEVETLGNDFDVVLIEADGAKSHPLKYPAPYEPVIPPFSEKVFVVGGLDALFKPFRDAVFRHELFSRSTGTEPPRLVYPDIFIRLFEDDALLKSTGGLNRTIVLNKYDTCRPRHLAAILMEKILDRTGIDQGVIAAAKHEIYYNMSHSSKTSERSHMSYRS